MGFLDSTLMKELIEGEVSIMMPLKSENSLLSSRGAEDFTSTKMLNVLAQKRGKPEREIEV